MGILNLLKRKKKNNTGTVHQEKTSQSVQAAADPAEVFNQFTGFCCSTTGGFYHSFRNADEEVLSVSSIVSPVTDIYLTGFGQNLCCKNVDYEITHIPGISRKITDEYDNCYGSYVYSDYDKTQIYIENQKINVTVHPSGWKFYIDSQEVAGITRLPEEQRTRGCENGFDTEKMYFAEISEKLDLKWYPLILGTPMIAF